MLNSRASKAELTWQCKHCGEQVEPLTVTVDESTHCIPRRHCDCPQALAEKEVADQERQRQEWREQAIRLITEAGLESRQYSRLRFVEWDVNRNAPHSQRALDQFTAYTESVESEGQNWLYAHGGYGLGKTHLSVAAVRKIAAENLWRPHVVVWPELCQMTKESWGGNGDSEASLWGRARAADILLIDDLDKTATSEWAMGKLYGLINFRSARQKATIITANHSLPELTDQWRNHKAFHVKDTGAAVLSRIQGQLAKIVVMKGSDQRVMR